jgi:hypothetical protein
MTGLLSITKKTCTLPTYNDSILRHTHRQGLSPPELIVTKHSLIKVTYTIPKYNFKKERKTCPHRTRSLVREGESSCCNRSLLNREVIKEICDWTWKIRRDDIWDLPEGRMENGLWHMEVAQGAHKLQNELKRLAYLCVPYCSLLKHQSYWLLLSVWVFIKWVKFTQIIIVIV